MAIQWYPGHMAKARRELTASLPSQDVIIEVLDARMPAASANPVLTELRGNKPCLKVLNKSDLADPEVTRAWLRHFESQGKIEAEAGRGGMVLALALTVDQPGQTTARVAELCRRLTHKAANPANGASVAEPSIRALVVGIPNVGKSTLINTLKQRKVAKTGDEPAVTKGQQQVILENGMTLWDNPGLLWPKIEDSETVLRLALGGAYPDTVIEYESVGLFGARYFLARYPALLRARFKLDALPATAELLLEAIGRRRGFLKRGGAVDVHKAAEILVHEFRAGTLGRISLEAPGDSEPRLE